MYTEENSKRATEEHESREVKVRGGNGASQASVKRRRKRRKKEAQAKLDY